MHLPTELIEEILSHIPSDDEESLRSCALIAKSWLDPCRRYLFESVCIETDTYQSWLGNISPTNAELLHHVRELMYAIRDNKSWHPSYRIGNDLRDYLPSFHRLQRLTFCLVDIEPTIPDHANLFFAFQHTLLSLTLVRVSITWNGFVTLLGYFPNLNDLEIREVEFEVGTHPTPQLPRALRGRLFIRCGREWDPEPFIDRFTELKLEYEELVIMRGYHPRLVAAVEGSLKRLRITRLNGKLSHRAHRFAAYASDRTSQGTPLWISRVAQNFASWGSLCCGHGGRSRPSSPPSPPTTFKSLPPPRGFHASSGTSSRATVTGYRWTILYVGSSTDCGCLGTSTPWKWSCERSSWTWTGREITIGSCQSSRRKDELGSWRFRVGNFESGPDG